MLSAGPARTTTGERNHPVDARYAAHDGRASAGVFDENQIPDKCHCQLSRRDAEHGATINEDVAQQVPGARFAG